MSQSQTAIEELAGRPLTTLSEDEQMFRSSVREFAEGELRPRVEEMDEKGKLDPALVKQCFDLGLMGIETPEERIAAGKPEKGTVYLAAKNDSGEIQIFVKDDGKGLDRDKLILHAKMKGLLKKPENEMTDKEVFSLIFLAGA
jgi:hypothetical protein